MRSRKLLILTVTALAVVGFPAALAFGFGPGEGLDPHEPPGLEIPIRSTEEAIAEDGREYADAYGVTQDEGARRIAAQLDTFPVVEAVREKTGAREAGIWLEHSPDFRMVLSLTGEYDDQAREIQNIVRDSPIPFVIRVGAPANLESLVAIQDIVTSTIPYNSYANVDVPTGTIEITLEQGVSPGAAAELQSQLSTKHGVPFLVTVGEQATDLSTYGGTRWDGTPLSNPVGDCTTGFTVTNGAGATGVLTAGHCPDTGEYWNLSFGPYATTFNAQHNDATRDQQWSSVVGVEYPNFWDGSSYRLVTGEAAKASQSG